jgi:positive regulator of sigma E activity
MIWANGDKTKKDRETRPSIPSCPDRFPARKIMTDERVKGRVTAREGGRVRVLLPLKNDCSSCGRCSLSSYNGKLEVWARGGEKTEPGDEVEIIVPRRDRLEASLKLFGIPLTGLFAGAAAGMLLGSYLGAGGETAAALGAGIGLLAGFLFVGLLERRRTAVNESDIRVAEPN